MKSFTLIALAGVTNAAAKGNWGYNNMGKDWNKKIGAVGSQCASGKAQSPINLSTTSASATKKTFTMTPSRFANTTGLETYMKGTKKGMYPHGAIYLERGEHPDGEVDMEHLKDSKCQKLSKKDLDKKANRDCLKFDGEAFMKITRSEGNDLTYEPAQIHMHAPSEHTIDGKYYDLEMHMVMEPSGKTKTAAEKFMRNQSEKLGDANFQVNYAVLGVMFYAAECSLNKGDAAYKQCKKELSMTTRFFGSMKMPDIWSKGRNWATVEDYARPLGQVPLKDFIMSLPVDEFFSYEGSLTTPPCAEGIRWTVLRKALPIDKSLMKLLNSKFKNDMSYAKGNGNNREIMPLNGREVFLQSGSAKKASPSKGNSFCKDVERRTIDNCDEAGKMARKQIPKTPVSEFAEDRDIKRAINDNIRMCKNIARKTVELCESGKELMNETSKACAKADNATGDAAKWAAKQMNMSCSNASSLIAGVATVAMTSYLF